jgi:mannose-1-phosphate guanylyltransferase/phosphomannomutase
VITRNDGKISRFLEKPSWGEVFSDTINTGIYVLEPEVLTLVPYRQDFDFSKNLFPMMLQQDLGLYGYVAEGYWRDVGNLNEYQEAHLDCLAGSVDITFGGTKTGNVYVGERCVIQSSASNLAGTVLVGDGCTIGEDVKIGNSVIGAQCTIESGVVIHNSVIWDNVRIEQRAELNDDVIGSHTIIGEGAVIAENVFISDKCTIGKRSKLLSNIKLWPEKIVEDGAVLSTSLVWEDKWLRELFSDARISGLSNIEMNPEFGAKLGAALGAFVGAGKTVVTSRDHDNVSRMMMRAVACGLMSAGVIVSDLRAMPIPLMRHELHNGKQAAGIHVRKSPHDRKKTDIIFFDGDGSDLPISKTKSIERLFFGEDFVRAKYDSVGSIVFSERTTESYRDRFISCLNTDIVTAAHFKIVIDYSNGGTATIFPNILGSLHCQVVSLNAYLDPKKLTRDEKEFQQTCQEVSHIVTSLKYDVGFILDAGGEKISVIDEHGKVIDHARLLTLVTKLFLATHPEAKRIAVPVSASSEVDIIANEHQVEVRRTPNTHSAMMNVAKGKETDFVGGTRGGFIFPEFIFSVDGIFSVAKILEMMALTLQQLGVLDAVLPKLHRGEKSIYCSWDTKGKVMRNAMHDSERNRRQLIDGIKIFHDNGNTWVLLLPDKERAVFHISVEAPTESVVHQLLDEYEKKVIAWRDS